MEVNSTFLEDCILKASIMLPQYAALISSVFERRYFKDSDIGDLVQKISDHIKEYHVLPDPEILINSSDNPERIKEIFKRIVSYDFDVNKQYDWLLEQTNEYLKECAIQSAILDSVDIIEKGNEYSIIRDIISTALSKDIKIDLGLDYFKEIKERMLRIVNNKKKKIPLYYPTIDELIQGGLPPCTLSFIIAGIHAGKCVEKNTKIKIKENNEEKEVNIEYLLTKTLTDVNLSNRYTNIGNLLEEKYGSVIGKERFNKWKSFKK